MELTVSIWPTTAPEISPSVPTSVMIIDGLYVDDMKNALRDGVPVKVATINPDIKKKSASVLKILVHSDDGRGPKSDASHGVVKISD